MANRVTPLTQIETLSGTISAQTYFDNNIGPAFTSLNDASLGYTNYSGTDSGALNAPVITMSFGTPSAYNTGMFVAFPPAFTNTSNVTLTITPLAPVAVIRADGTPLSGGEIVISEMAMMIFDGTSFRLLPQSVRPGNVEMIAGTVIPPGYLLCNGAAVNRTTYAPLFARCGTTYGAGDGSTTFNIPNMSGGRFPVAPGTVGASGGASTVALGVTQLPVHNHVINISDPGHAHTLGDAVGITNGAFANCIKVSGTGNGTGAAGTGITATSNNAGSGAAFSILPPFLTFNFAIKT